jgi:glycosyltransferase involved in cell wall biosynthesis
MDFATTALPVHLKSVRPLRLCVVTETYPPEVNGVAMTTDRLVEGMLDRGHRIQLIRPRQTSDDDVQYRGSLEVLPQPSLNVPMYRELKLGLPVGRRLLRLWRQSPPDVIHIETEGPLGRSALMAARRLKLPVISNFHTNFHHYSRYYGLGLLSRPIIAYLKRFHNRSACTLVPTEELAEQLRSAGFHNIRILSRGVDTRQFSPRHRSQALRQSWGAGASDRVVLYVGRLASEKNLDLAITAFQAIRRHKPGSLFVLVGDGPMAVGLRKKHPEFIYCGMRTGEDLAVHYASGDLFLLPSMTETFGNVTLEAMASGLPLVAFDYAAARCLVKYGQNGLLVPMGDDGAFVTAARELVTNIMRLRQMGRAARRRVEPFDWDQVCDCLEQIFLEVRHKTNYIEQIR